MRRPAWLTGRRALIAGAGGVLAVAIGVGLPRLLRRMAFFEVRRVEVEGARYLPVEDIVRVLAVEPGRSIFDPVAPLAQRVFAVVGVREVVVRRRLPGVLRVTIRESEPVALAPHEGRLVLVDERGWVLPFDPARVPSDLPVAEADSALAGLLDRLRAADPDRYAELVSAARRGRDVMLEAVDRRLLVRADATAEVFLDVAAVVADLARRGMGWRELDARFAGRVFVRGVAGGA